MTRQLQDDNKSVSESMAPTENSESSIIKPSLTSENKSQYKTTSKWKSALLKTLRDSAVTLSGPEVDPWMSQDRRQASSVTSKPRERQSSTGVDNDNNKEPTSTRAV